MTLPTCLYNNISFAITFELHCMRRSAFPFGMYRMCIHSTNASLSNDLEHEY